jgi:co-chaperonin GroES (HSP10)
METTQFSPNGLRYLVLPDEVEAQAETVGGLTFTKEADRTQEPTTGTIVSIGDGTRDGITCKYAAGTKVVFGKYSGAPFQLTSSGPKHKILAETEILGTLN